MKAALERVDVPDAELARERARVVALAAFAQREPLPPRRPTPRVALGVAVAGALVLAVLSPPGRAVVDRVREAVGVEQAQPALFSLPTGGPLLVASAPGVWVVERDGSKRLLRGYREATWSPFGRFVIGARANELAALEPDGDVRWTLARPGVRSPRWTGTESNTRIAYVDRTGIRIVAGDGTRDRLLVPDGSGPIAWRPGAGFVLAYVSASEVRVEDSETGRVVWRANRGNAEPATHLEWSVDGRRLLVLARQSLKVFAAGGRLVGDEASERSPNVAAAFARDSAGVVVARRRGSESVVAELATGRLLFNGTGTFDGMTFSPDGRWLVISWPTADQWVFVGVAGPRRIRAVAGIAEQFRGRARIEGWCCRG